MIRMFAKLISCLVPASIVLYLIAMSISSYIVQLQAVFHGKKYVKLEKNV